MLAQDIHRRSDGSIDIEFYRERGLMARRAVIARVFRAAGRKRGLIALAAAAAVIYVAMPRDDAGATGRSGALQTALSGLAPAAR